MFRIPMFGFALLVFVLLAVVLAVAVFLAFRSGEQGKTKLGGLAGCAIALALLLITGAAALGLLIVSVISIPSEAVRHGPVKSFEFQWGEATPTPGESPRDPNASPLRLRIEMRGVRDTTEIMKWLREQTDEHTHIAVREETDPSGKAFTVVELSIPLDEHEGRELRRIRHDLEQHLPDLRLPASVHVEFEGPDD